MNSNPTNGTVRTPARSATPRSWWTWARGGLLAVAFLATAIAGFYTIEDWRGRRAWDRCRHELEARGEKLDWKTFIPAPVPDASNFFKAPGMIEWFSKNASAANTRTVRLLSLPGDPRVRDWPMTLEQVRALPEAPPADSMGIDSRSALRQSFAELAPEYDLLAAACARPQSRLAEDYAMPFSVDIPNFVNAREVAQTLSVHANLSLVDGRADVAAADLGMIARLAQVMGENQTLVGTMIDVAIMGSYVQTARDGIEANLFLAPQLVAIQEQVEPIDLLPVLTASMRGAERAGVIWLLDQPRAQIEAAFYGHTGPGRASRDLSWDRIFRRFALSLCPRGWIHQNQAFLARLDQELLDALDPEARRVQPEKLDAIDAAVAERFQRFSPYRWLAGQGTPNFVRAVKTLACNQTLLDQLRVACALERFRLAEGAYPESLDALRPDYLDHVPHDLFVEQPLQYQRDKPDAYRLWSMGWNKTDDGGEPVPAKRVGRVYTDADRDWVWALNRGK